MIERQQITSGFTQAGVYARRQFCADIQACSPQELLWNPRLREAATTLYAIFGKSLRYMLIINTKIK